MTRRSIFQPSLAVVASLLVLAASSVCGADAAPPPAQEKKLFDQAEQAWDGSSPKTA